MKYEKITFSSIPATFFIIGILFLYNTNLSLPQIIEVQYSSIDVFLQELMSNDLKSASVNLIKYLWDNALWIVTFFMMIITLGLVSYTYLFDKMDFRIVIITQSIFVLLSLFLFNFSIIGLLIPVSLFVGILWMQKTFERKKNDFSTAYSVISSRLTLFNLFLCVGIFLTILMNFQTYEEIINKSNMDFLGTMIPDSSDIQEAQKKQIQQISEGFKLSLTQEYQVLPTNVRTQCSPMYDAMIQGFDNYEQTASEKIDEQGINLEQMDIIQTIPIVGMMSKITPIFIVLSIYAFISVMNSLMGIFGGLVYSLITKIKPIKNQ
jgi:hypothetical protein